MVQPNIIAVTIIIIFFIFFVAGYIPSARRFLFYIILAIIPKRNAHKKERGTFRFHRNFRGLGLPISPNLQRVKPTPLAGASLLYSGRNFESVQVPKVPVLSYFAFSYSMMCILIYALCFIGKMFRYYSLEFDCKITTFFLSRQIYFRYVAKLSYFCIKIK